MSESEWKSILFPFLILVFILVVPERIIKIMTEPEVRYATGTYYNDFSIVTDDGNEWLLPEQRKQPFEDGQRVGIKFDTKRTSDLLDDEIMEIYSE